MVLRYSLGKFIRLALILTAVCAVCFLGSCKSSGQDNGEGAELPPPTDITESAPAPEISETPETIEPETPSQPPEKTPATPEVTVTPEVSETPEETDVSEQPEPSEPQETWNTPNRPKSGQMPEIPQTPENEESGAEGVIPQDRVYPEPDKIAYITIDDGPTRAITPQILDILSELGVRATFFVLPHSNVEDLYQRILDEGHVIGNHSFSHKYKPLYAEDTAYFIEDLMAMHSFIFDMLGYTPTLYRFPGGAMGRNKDTIAVRVEILEEYGYTYYDWNSSAGDADASGEGKDAQVLIDNVLEKTNGRQQLIVLMHDSLGKQTTVDALPFIIDGLRMQGYAFDTLDNFG